MFLICDGNPCDPVGPSRRFGRACRSNHVLLNGRVLFLSEDVFILGRLPYSYRPFPHVKKSIPEAVASALGADGLLHTGAAQPRPGGAHLEAGIAGD
eukprot:4077688-Pleurochrysis_carterae.AAC.2